jgi:hypothetical protein
MVLGACVIACSWLLTWIYVRWANTRYDAALRTGSTLVLIWLSPTVQVDVLKHPTARSHEAEAYSRMEWQKHLGGAA